MKSECQQVAFGLQDYSKYSSLNSYRNNAVVWMVSIL